MSDGLALLGKEYFFNHAMRLFSFFSRFFLSKAERCAFAQLGVARFGIIFGKNKNGLLSQSVLFLVEINIAKSNINTLFKNFL